MLGLEYMFSFLNLYNGALLFLDAIKVRYYVSFSHENSLARIKKLPLRLFVLSFSIFTIKTLPYCHIHGIIFVF